MGKYAMLRSLTDVISVGVVWFAQPDGACPASSHGSRRTYGGTSRTAAALRAIDPRHRCPTAAVGLPEPMWPPRMSYPADHSLNELRPNWRISRFDAALNQIGGRDLVFIAQIMGWRPLIASPAHTHNRRGLRLRIEGQQHRRHSVWELKGERVVGCLHSLRQELRRVGHRVAPFGLRWSSNGPAGSLIVPASSGAAKELRPRARDLARRRAGFFEM
jgi:hypothetical protein